MRGFSSCKQDGWNSLYILADQEDLDIYIDGFPTGLQAPSQIFLEPSCSSVQVELKRLDHSVFVKDVEIHYKKSFLMGYVQRRLHLFA